MTLHLSPDLTILLHATVTLMAAAAAAAISLMFARKNYWLTISIALWIPAIIIAFQIPLFLNVHETDTSRLLTLSVSLLQGLLLSPTLGLPAMMALSNAHPDLSRTAKGLGADSFERIRFLWLPLLRKRLLFGFASGTLLAGLMAHTLISYAYQPVP
ncbi:hypothetical protein [Acetobacter oeni]|uniref:ABC transmembrane type-1 domain-containing protein n=1 Tax=Acetobacter oeni TaxID=304077 RepID=A0A511XI62_9PROT|nr:hypothetical protein [Acetobacter oeni]MBB3883045.1 ABC-type spermidine/putrescine transport system permease subunit II [Acetobacter oeni]NHO19121.1 hypothetical protein [Acetobacter oeni]GEN62629.1 hypothetical protein AOE01nite_08530 [Acetobacter oeni]